MTTIRYCHYLNDKQYLHPTVLISLRTYTVLSGNWEICGKSFFFLMQGNMSDKKAIIKNADMPNDMQQDAVDYAIQAMEKYNIEKDIAAYVKKACQIMDQTWAAFMEIDDCCMIFLLMLFSSCRSLTKSTTPHGTASLGRTLAAMLHMRQNTSFISTWLKWPFYCSSQVEMQTFLHSEH